MQLVLRPGPADEEVVRYTNEHPIDLAIVQAPRRATRRRSHTRSSSAADARCSCCGDSERPAARGLLERLVSDGGRVGNDLVVFARSARRDAARHLPRPVAAAADAAPIGAAGRDRRGLRRRHARVRRGRARGRGRRHVDQRRDHRQLLRAARARLRAFGRGPRRRSAGRRPLRRRARRCVLRRVDVPHASPMRRRLRWSR